MIIGFDLDDVVVDSESFLREYILKKENYDIGLNRKEYMVAIPGKTKEYADDLVKEAYSHIEKAKPVKNALQTIKKIYDLTSEKICFITSRHTSGWIPGPSNLKDKTIDWLDRHIKGPIKFPWEVIFTDGQPKSSVIPPSMCFFVEDIAFFANEASHKLIHVFLIKKSWNEDVFVNSNVLRVQDINTVYLFLKKMINISSNLLSFKKDKSLQ